MLLRLLIGGVVGVLIAGMVQAAEPGFALTLKKADDSITASGNEERRVFTIVSPSGIGTGTIALKEGRWAKEVELRFQQSKTQAFKEMEGFTLTTARFKIAGSRKQSAALLFYLVDADGKFSETPAGTLNVVMEVKEGALVVRLPANLLLGADKVELAWIDYYR